MHIKNKRGQSTVEYILLVTAVIAVIIVFTTGKGNYLGNQLNTALNEATQDIGTGGTALSASHSSPASNTDTGTPNGISVVVDTNAN